MAQPSHEGDVALLEKSRNTIDIFDFKGHIAGSVTAGSVRQTIVFVSLLAQGAPERPSGRWERTCSHWLDTLFDSPTTGQDAATELLHFGSTAWRDLMML